MNPTPQHAGFEGKPAIPLRSSWHPPDVGGEATVERVEHPQEDQSRLTGLERLVDAAGDEAIALLEQRAALLLERLGIARGRGAGAAEQTQGQLVLLQEQSGRLGPREVGPQGHQIHEQAMILTPRPRQVAHDGLLPPANR